MASFDIDIGHGRTLCIEATSKGVNLITYTNLPCGKLIKVSAKTISLDLKSWKKFNDNIDEIRSVFTNLTDEREIKTDYTLNLGKYIYIRAISAISCVHIRKYYFDIDEAVIKPGRPGIAFKYPEFRELLKNLENINEITCINTVESCCTSETQKDCNICSL